MDEYFKLSSQRTLRTCHVIGSSEPGPLYGIEFLSFTYVVGKLTLQLLAPRWKSLSHRGRPLISLNPNVYWEQAVILFWPHPGEFLSWPPEKRFGDDMIDTFIESVQ